MKKKVIYIVCFILTLVLSGCQKQTNKAFHVLCPMGAPTLAFVSEYESIKENGSIDFVDGSQQLIAELSKNDSQYDIIVAPINVGTKLIEKKQTDYRLKAVITWGNLYLVGKSDALSKDGEIALFGEGAVPQKIIESLDLNTKLKSHYYQSATLVQQQLLAEKVNVGMLAEPLATATIAKAKKSGIELSILTDLQKEYSEQGYPQAAIFIKDTTEADQLFDKIDDFTNNGYQNLETYLNDIGVETLSLPSVDITIKTMERQNIHYREASECQDEIKEFLKLFDIQFSQEMLSQ